MEFRNARPKVESASRHKVGQERSHDRKDGGPFVTGSPEPTSSKMSILATSSTANNRATCGNTSAPWRARRKPNPLAFVAESRRRKCFATTLDSRVLHRRTIARKDSASTSTSMGAPPNMCEASSHARRIGSRARAEKAAVRLAESSNRQGSLSVEKRVCGMFGTRSAYVPRPSFHSTGHARADGDGAQLGATGFPDSCTLDR